MSEYSLKAISNSMLVACVSFASILREKFSVSQLFMAFYKFGGVVTKVDYLSTHIAVCSVVIYNHIYHNTSLSHSLQPVSALHHESHDLSHRPVMVSNVLNINYRK